MSYTFRLYWGTDVLKQTRLPKPRPVYYSDARPSTPRDELYRILCRMSEEHYCAGWLDSMPRELWEMIREPGDTGWGLATVTAEKKDHLALLAGMAGGWWHWPRDSEHEVFVTTDEWEALMAQGERR